MSRIVVFVLVVSLALSCFGQGIPVLTGYNNVINATGTLLNNDGSANDHYFVIYYSVLEPNIHVGIVCDTDAGGYCAFGISTSGLMVGFKPGVGSIPSDAAVGYINESGSVIVEDFILGGRLTSNNCPNTGAVCADTSSGFVGCENNVVVRNGGRGSGNFIWFEFSRPLAASDECDVEIPVNGSAISILSSYGAFLNGSVFPFNVDQHEGHGPQETNVTFLPATTTGTTGVRSTTASVTTGQSTTATVTTSQSTTATVTTGQSTTAKVTSGKTTTSGQQNSVGTIAPVMISFVIGSLFVGLFVYFRTHAQL